MLRGSLLVLLSCSTLVAASQNCYHSQVASAPDHMKVPPDTSSMLQTSVMVGQKSADVNKEESLVKRKYRVGIFHRRQIKLHFWNGGNRNLSCYLEKRHGLQEMGSVGRPTTIVASHGQTFVFKTDDGKQVSLHSSNASRGSAQHYIIDAERAHHHERPLWTPSKSAQSAQSSVNIERKIYIMGSTDLFRFCPSFAHFIMGHVLPVASLLDSEGLLTPTQAQSLRLVFSCPPGRDASESCDARNPQNHFPASRSCCQAMLNPGKGENRLAFYSALFPLGAQLVAWPPRVDADTRLLVVPSLQRATADTRIFAVTPKVHWMILNRVPRAERELQILFVSRNGPKTEHTTFFRDRLLLNEESVLIQLEHFAAKHSLNLRHVALESMSIVAQATLMSNTDILVSMHGAALAYAALLPPRSIVVEFLPSGFDYCFFHSTLSHQTIWIQEVDAFHAANRSKPWSAKNTESWNSNRHVDPSAFLRLLHQAQTPSGTSLIACPEQESTFVETMRTWMKKYSSNDKYGAYCPSHPRIQHSVRDAGHVSQGSQCKEVRALADGAILVSEGAPL